MHVWAQSDMDHVAFMKKEWGFVEKVLSGTKTIESRWYLTKRAPFNKINTGDMVYFKNSGEPVTVKADVEKVLEFSDLNVGCVKTILSKYGKDIGIEKKDTAKFLKKFRGKKYVTLIFLKNTRRIRPFVINKKSFGQMASWITVKDISTIKI